MCMYRCIYRYIDRGGDERRDHLGNERDWNHRREEKEILQSLSY